MQKAILTIASVLPFSASAEKEGKNYHEVISWTPPLESNDFNNWAFAASSVPLENKIVLAPNGHEQFGYMSNTWVSYFSLVITLLPLSDLRGDVVGNEHRLLS